MALTLCTLTGTVVLPDDTAPSPLPRLVFTLSNLETDGEVIVPRAFEVEVDPETGEFSGGIWPNERGSGGSHYAVALWSGYANGRETAITGIGAVVIPDQPTAALADVLAVSPPPPGQVAQPYSPVLTALASGQVTTGVRATAVDDGRILGGTYEPDPTSGNMRLIEAAGSFIFSAPSAEGDYTMVVLITNGATAGAITFSGFARTGGDNLTTEPGDAFFAYLTRLAGFATLTIEALQ